MIPLLGACYVILALLGDVGLKLWAERRIPSWALLLVMAIHGAASAAWAAQMRHGAGFGRSAVVLIVANLAGAVLLSALCFDEPLTRQHYGGLLAAAVAVALLA